MTGVLFGSMLLLTAVAWLAVVSIARSPYSVGRFLAFSWLVVAPCALFTSVVITAFAFAPAGDYRVALEAIEFRMAAGEAVTVGGGTEGDEADDLIVRDLPPRYMTFRAETNHLSVELPDAFDHEIENPAYAAVRVDNLRPFSNSVSLAGNKHVVIVPSDHERLDLNIATGAIRANGATFSTITPRVQSLGPLTLKIKRNLLAETEMFPLRFFARSAQANDATGTDGAPLGSFLSWDGGYFRQDLHLTLVNDGTSVVFDNGRVVSYQTKIAEIAPGDHRDIALYRVDYSDNPTEGRSRVQERRSFRASFAQDRLSIVYDTPDIVRLSSASIAKLTESDVKRDGFLLATRDRARNAPFIQNQMALSFPELGPRMQNEFYSSIRVSDAGECNLRVTSHTGTRCYGFGDAFRIGDDAAAVLRVTKISISWGVILTLVALTAFSAVWMTWLQSDPLAVVLVSAAEVFLAVRLLIGFEGALLDPAAASALWESLAIFAILPLVIRVAWAWSRSGRGPTRLVCTVLTVPPAALVGVALFRAHVGATTIGFVCATTVILPFAGAVASWLIKVLTSRRWSLKAISIYALVIIGLRLLMWLVFGWKERISIGSADLAVTVLYLPAVFIFFAGLWEQYRTVGSNASLGWTIGFTLLATVFGGVLVVGVPIAVSDSGSALVHAPALALFFALPFVASPSWRRSLLALPFGAIVLAHLYVLVIPQLRGIEDIESGSGKAYQDALASEDAAIHYFEERVQQSTNQLRIMASLSPHQLEQAGTSKAEGLVTQRRMLDRYGGRGIWGTGYLNLPLSLFRDTHLNDNLSALHILAPFGAVGALGIIVLLALLAVLPVNLLISGSPSGLLGSVEAAIDQRTAIGLFALWNFSIVGIYMFAANLGLVLFTGKNVYLLAASSKSDAIEGGVLLLTALLALVL